MNAPLRVFRFAIDAFSALAVDYLLKPVADMALAQALQKVERLRRSFGTEVAALLLQQLGPAPPRWRQRMVGRKGAQFHALTVERLAYVVSVDKLVFAVDAAGERFLRDTPLAELEAALDPQRLFRANRQMLLAADAVVRFAPAGKGRIKVELRTPGAGAVIVSQERAAAFKARLAGQGRGARAVVCARRLEADANGNAANAVAPPPLRCRACADTTWTGFASVPSRR